MLGASRRPVNVDGGRIGGRGKTDPPSLVCASEGERIGGPSALGERGDPRGSGGCGESGRGRMWGAGKVGLGITLCQTKVW